MAFDPTTLRGATAPRPPRPRPVRIYSAFYDDGRNEEAPRDYFPAPHVLRYPSRFGAATTPSQPFRFVAPRPPPQFLLHPFPHPSAATLRALKPTPY